MYSATGVPPAQKKDSFEKVGVEMSNAKWIAKIDADTEKVIASGRITSEDAQADLRECVRLLSAPPEPFSWDIAMYVNATRANAVQACIDEDSDIELQLPEESKYDPDDEDESGAVRPQWQINETYLIRLDIPPFWGLARSILILFFISILFRMLALPFKPDRYWRATVQFFVPEQKILPLEGRWRENVGCPQDIFASVFVIALF